MTKTFYIASALANAALVESLAIELEKNGWHCTFAWWRESNAKAGATVEAQKKRARQDARGAAEADWLILVLPARHGSHFEAGISVGVTIASGARPGRRTIIWDPNGESHDGDYPCVFHQLQFDLFGVQRCTAGTLNDFMQWLFG